jgi:hypothetical protein
MKALLALLVFIAATAPAADFVDTAEVISSTPIIERIEPRQECGPPAETGQRDTVRRKAKD